MKRESLKEKVVEQVYDYLVEHGMGTPLQLEQALGVDIKLVRAALNKLEKEGRMTQKYVTIPQPPRVVPVRIASPHVSVTPPKHVNMKPLPPSPEIGTQARLPSTPPRIMPIRVPESTKRKSQEQIQKARVEQQRARERQREIKKKSTIP